ncbi:MAG: SRPBCC family protein [Gammaproteobacteria bacterium]|nr:SRPBCC family protein [Gammaproteobacteria bacterium]
MPTTNQSVVVDAPIAAVWSRFSDFHDLSWAPNVITSVVKVGSIDGGTPGAKRILNNAFHETLIEIDEDGYMLRYSIDDGPPPVSRDDVDDYVGVVSLSPVNEGNGTLVEWTSSWNSKVDDAVEFCHGIYVALLGELARSFDR